jgi:F420-non-reducing hydrogenase iron-sulfur subunit
MMHGYRPKILVVTMERSSYLAADALGQMHMEYPASIYMLRTILPAVLPYYFYVDSLKKGIGGVIIASGGSDCPVAQAFEVLSTSVKRAQAVMKEEGIAAKRLRLVAICSVCTGALLKEINLMSDTLRRLKAEGKME